MIVTNLSPYQSKIKSADTIAQLLEPSCRKKRVIMCHGTFDIVHPGHIRHLLFAKSKGDILIASLTCDEHITKSNMRPYVPEELRAANLAAFEMVDYVIIDNDPTPIENIKKIKPDLFCKGFEYAPSDETNSKTQEEIDIVQGYGGEVIFSPGDIVYSSSKLIETNAPSIAADKLKLLMDAEGLSFEGLAHELSTFNKLHVHVIGDTIVDSLTQCSMIGGMTKTPTVSARFDYQDDYVGGAAIVAKHLKAAGAEVTFSTVLGEDNYKNYVIDDLKKAGINVLALLDKTRPTTHKNAIVVNDYRLLKIDTLDNRAMPDKILKELTHNIKNVPADIVILSDFRHGIFSKESIPKIINAIPEGAFKVADSQVASRWGNILDFKKFNLITPNEKEARFALGDQDSVIRPLGTKLYKKSGSESMILKVGAKGIMGFRSSDTKNVRSFFTLDSFCNNLVDSVGAGDALLAYATLALASCKNLVAASILGNCAAAIECESDGNIPVPSEKVIAKLTHLKNQISYTLPSRAA